MKPSCLAVALAVGCLAIATDGFAQNVTVTPTKGPLPQTSKMKLAGDPANYIKRECGTSVKYKLCEVFAQSDPKGSLVGYVLFYQMPNNSVVFASDSLTSGVGAKECLIGGNFDDEKFDSAVDFKQRSTFEYKRSSGAVAGGMFYLERVGPRLRINDERWNYCYDARHIDDVWTLLGRATP